MESNLKKILKKYSDFKYFLLKNLDIRQSKIQVIWNQINSPRINKIVKIKNSKNKPKKNSFLNNDFSTFKLPKDLNISILFRNSRKNKLKNKKSNLLKKQNKFNLKISNIFISNKLSKYSYKSLQNSLSSIINLNYFDEKTEKYLKFKVSDVIKKFKTNKLTKNRNDLDLLIDLLGIYYVNNKVFFAHLKRKNKSNIIQDIVQINAPSDLIGDYKVEKIPEFKRMIEDITNVFELKNPTDTNATIASAYEQIHNRYKRDIPHLLRYCPLSCISDATVNNTKLGTTYTPYNHYYAWKKVDNEIYQHSIYYETTRLASYADFEGMEFFPEIAAALDIFMEESTSPNGEGRILNIFSFT